jgi:hypothetical protein
MGCVLIASSTGFGRWVGPGAWRNAAPGTRGEEVTVEILEKREK